MTDRPNVPVPFTGATLDKVDIDPNESAQTDAQRPGTPGKSPTDGRFVAGNKLGKGNPLGRHAKALRRRMSECCTEIQVEAMMGSLYRMGVEDGDVTAAKLWLEYAVGKPKAMEAEEDEEGTDAKQAGIVINLVNAG